MFNAQLCAQDIQQLGSVIHSFRGQAQHVFPNASTLPKLTIRFEVVLSQTSSTLPAWALVFRSPESMQELRHKSIHVLLECEVALTSDTLSLSLSFVHANRLCSFITSESLELDPILTHPASRHRVSTTRIVRVLPPVFMRPKIINGCLPTELLIMTFEDTEFCDTWHVDLLSFAQVCRAWACAMDVLHAKLPFSDDNEPSQSRPCLDVYALAKALRERPLLAHAFRHFSTNNLDRQLDKEGQPEHGNFFVLPGHCPPHKHSYPFMAALISIVGTMKNLECVHFGHVDSSQLDALLAVTQDLSSLHTFSIWLLGRPHMLSVVQFSSYMARWPSLRSLKMQNFHLHRGRIPSLSRLVHRPPPCTLTQLTFTHSHVPDRDLEHLFAASLAAQTLEYVVLNRVTGISNAGLAAFLHAIAPSVVTLSVQHVAPPLPQRGHLVLPGRTGSETERALDGVVHVMSRLRELRIGGDVASGLMLDRRSRTFVARLQADDVEGTGLPVVHLWMEGVPQLKGFIVDEKWPGWCTPRQDATTLSWG